MVQGLRLSVLASRIQGLKLVQYKYLISIYGVSLEDRLLLMTLLADYYCPEALQEGHPNRANNEEN